MSILLYIFCIFIGAAIGCIAMALVSADKTVRLETKNSCLNDDIVFLKKRIGNFEHYIDELKSTNAILDKELQTYKQSNTKLKDEIDMLNDLIVNMPKSEAPEKERLPEGPTNMFCYMDYKKLDNQTADQYWLQQECETNNLGIRTYGYYLCVAMGSAYGQNIGDTWRITLENGVSFAVILADCKGDDADSEFGHKLMNYDGQDCTNVIEFVVDKDEMYGDVKNAGTFSMCDIFGGLNGSGGNIKSIEYTGRVWKRS